MTVPPWTFTGLSEFSNCPYKFYRKRIAIDLPREAKSDAQQRGIDVHKGFETAFKRGALPHVVAPWAHMIEPLRARSPVVEMKLAMTEDNQRADYFDMPFGRGALDAIMFDNAASPRIAFIVDWKTGKVREDKRELECQAVLAKANFPSLEKVTGCYGWLVENRFGQIYDLSNISRPLASIHANVADMRACDASGQWARDPNPLCGWCPVVDCLHNRSET